MEVAVHRNAAGWIHSLERQECSSGGDGTR
jgi:hypothetical protein